MCRVADLRDKEVINLKNGERLGCVCDVEIDVLTGKVVSIVVPGKRGILGFFGKGDDLIICWDDIDKIGEDYIFVCLDLFRHTRKKKESLFSCMN